MADQIDRAMAGLSQLRNELVDKRDTKAKENAEIHKAATTSDGELKAADDELARFDAQFPGIGKKKPGPKPGSKKGAKKTPAKKTAAKAKPKKRAKAATKKVAKKKTAAKKKTPAKKTSNSAAAEGRRAVARGDRPVLKEAMKTVMGGQTMAAQDIVDGLTKRGWLPNAKDPRTYISFTLSANKDAFERIEGKRGYYRVRKGTAKAAATAPKKAAKKAAPKKAAAKAAPKKNNAPKKPVGDVNKGLKDLGIGESNVASNPFG